MSAVIDKIDQITADMNVLLTYVEILQTVLHTNEGFMGVSTAGDDYPAQMDNVLALCSRSIKQTIEDVSSIAEINNETPNTDNLFETINELDNLSGEIGQSRDLFEITYWETAAVDITPEKAYAVYKRLQTLHGVFFDRLCSERKELDSLVDKFYKITKGCKAADK